MYAGNVKVEVCVIELNTGEVKILIAYRKPLM
jgi:hypothetical protein